MKGLTDLNSGRHSHSAFVSTFVSESPRVLCTSVPIRCWYNFKIEQNSDKFSRIQGFDVGAALTCLTGAKSDHFEIKSTDASNITL